MSSNDAAAAVVDACIRDACMALRPIHERCVCMCLLHRDERQPMWPCLIACCPLACRYGSPKLKAADETVLYYARESRRRQEEEQNHRSSAAAVPAVTTTTTTTTTTKGATTNGTTTKGTTKATTTTKGTLRRRRRSSSFRPPRRIKAVAGTKQAPPRPRGPIACTNQPSVEAATVVLAGPAPSLEALLRQQVRPQHSTAGHRAAACGITPRLIRQVKRTLAVGACACR
jgi:hypothetical protein